MKYLMRWLHAIIRFRQRRQVKQCLYVRLPASVCVCVCAYLCVRESDGGREKTAIQFITAEAMLVCATIVAMAVLLSSPVVAHTHAPTHTHTHTSSLFASDNNRRNFVLRFG